MAGANGGSCRGLFRTVLRPASAHWRGWGYNVDEVLFSSNTGVWETPQGFFDVLDSEFHFTLGACALPSNAKCARYYTPEQDGLSQPWDGVVWCNPPYGRDVALWIQKAARSSHGGATVVMLLPARTDTAWFHDYIYHRAEVRFVRGRLRFGVARSGAPFPSMVVVFRPSDADIT